VDLHSHLLPGLDDGAPTLETAMRHARRLHAEGVRDVACTPHVKRDHFPHARLEVFAERRGRLQRAIEAEGLDLRLHQGGELAHHDALELAPHELRLIAQGPPHAPWLLLECPFEGLDAAFDAAVARLTGLGYGLLLAHPERVEYGGLERLEPHIEAGALLQVNVSSLLGRHGSRPKEIGVSLVRRGHAYCLASDAHPGTREFTVAMGAGALLQAGAGEVTAERLTAANPRVLLREGTAPPALTLGRAA
jgi:protein-tyrosine phosphatase